MPKSDIELVKPPTPPAAPKNALAADMADETRRSTPGIDRPIRGGWDAMSPRDVSEGTRGPIKNVGQVNKAFTDDYRRRLEASDRVMRKSGPVQLKSGRSLSGKR